MSITAGSSTESLTTREVAAAAIETLREGNVVLGDGEIDYAAADMLEILVELHDLAEIDLEQLETVREFARLVVEGWSL